MRLVGELFAIPRRSATWLREGTKNLQRLNRGTDDRNKPRVVSVLMALNGGLIHQRGFHPTPIDR
jgi:hypothetical protein